MSVLATGALTVGGVVVEQQQFNGTKDRVAEAKKALMEYFAVNGRLPCAARFSAAPNTANYGVEVDCTAVVADTTRVGGNLRIGALPVRTLGLRDSAMGDEYGNRLLYAVSEDFTNAGTVAAGTGRITMRDGGGNAIATAGTNNAGAFVVFSTGPDGKGGYRLQTGAARGGCTGGLDTENCNGDAVFRDAKFNNATGAAAFYDDMLAWAPKYLMTVSASSTAAAGTSGQVQYNNGGFLGASANFFWDIANNRLRVGHSGVANHALDVYSAADSLTAKFDSPGPWTSIKMRAGNTAINNLGLFLHYGGTGAGDNNQLRLGRANPATADMPWTTANPVIFDLDAPDTSLIVSGNGNVGIGTPGLAPEQRLQVNGSMIVGQYGPTALSADGWGPALHIGGNTTSNSDWIYFQRHNYASDGSNLYLVLGDNAGGEDHFIISAAGTNRLTVRNDGHTAIRTNLSGGYALDAYNAGTHGVVGNGADYGLVGYARNSGGYGVHGYNTNTASQGNLAQGQNGVVGYTNINTSAGYGVYGQSIVRGSYCGIGRGDGWSLVCDNGNNWLRGLTHFQGNPSAHGQTSVRIYAPGGALHEDWPGGWGGGLATFDVAGASTYFSHYVTRSDRRYKKDIQTLDGTDALQSIMRLRPVNYRWKDKKMLKNLQYGLIAQEVRDVLPELVTGRETKTERLGLNYDGLIAPLIASVQELKRSQDRISEALPHDGSSTPERQEHWFRIILAAVVGLTSFALLVFALELRRVRSELTWWRAQARQHGWIEPAVTA